MTVAPYRSLDDGLRQWQVEALKEWEAAGQRGIVEVVTGGGKTRFALACMSDWLKENDGAVVVLVPTTALQDQWFVNLIDDLGVPEHDVALWPDNKDKSRRFHIMVVNTARNRIGEISDDHAKVLLVADECHRYASPENARALKIRSSASLGLTATADREFDDGLERNLIPNLGPIIYRYGLDQARADRVVSEFQLFNARVPFGPAEAEEYERASKSLARAMTEGDEDRIKRIAMRRASIAKNAVARVSGTVAIAERLRGRKMIVFHEDIARADLIAQILRQRGHRVVTYHSKISKDFRRDNLRMFRRGMADVLVCCRALDEGIDIPEADCAILSASTSSHRQRVQRLGRVLRTHEGKEMASIYTIFVTDQERDRLALESEQISDSHSTKWLELK